MGSSAAKAAQMIILLGEEAAGEVMSLMNETEIEQLTREIAKTGNIDPEQADKDAEEFYQMLVANRFVAQGGQDFARNVILKSLGAGSAKRIMDRLSSPYATSMDSFQMMDRVSPIQLSQFIQHEHPQTIALVLAHLKPRNAAELLETLQDSLQADIAVRMANIEEIPPEIVDCVADVLAEKLKPVGKSYSDDEGSGGIRTVAEMFNRLDRKQSKAVLEMIEGDTPEIASSIRELMFIFDDILSLDSAAMREILQRVDKKTISQSLKGTVEELQNQFFDNMSQRAVEILKEEIEILGPMKARDVHSAQQKVVDVVRQLEDEGVINVAGVEDDYVV